MADARKIALDASSAAKRAEMTNRIFVGAGVLAIVGVIVGLFSLFGNVNANVIATHSLIGTVSMNATQASADAKRALDDIKDLRMKVESANTRHSVDEFARLQAQLDETRSQVETLNAQVETLNSEVRRLIDQMRNRP